MSIPTYNSLVNALLEHILGCASKHTHTYKRVIKVVIVIIIFYFCPDWRGDSSWQGVGIVGIPSDYEVKFCYENFFSVFCFENTILCFLRIQNLSEYQFLYHCAIGEIIFDLHLINLSCIK